jgi:Fic family protein
MLRVTYIHELPDWPRFQWREQEVIDLLATVRHQQGVLLGRMGALGFDLRQEAELKAVTDGVVKTSEIEGEVLNPAEVRSSVASRLGIDIGGFIPTRRDVDGIVNLMIDATARCHEPLTEERLFKWHSSLFPTGWNNMGRITVGAWRKPGMGAMRVVSGRIGKERVHFEAPSEDRLEAEMHDFLTWFNAPSQTDDMLKAALAHLWFVTIHPFDDGNGRIARAIADMALARSDDVSQRFYSMSSQIRNERAEYYQILELTQKGVMDITNWMVWFLDCLGRTIDNAQETVASAITRVKFWDEIADVPLNARQRKVIRRLVSGFEGKLTTAKWSKMTKCSQDTALRDISHLIENRILERSSAGGRSTSYALVNQDLR